VGAVTNTAVTNRGRTQRQAVAEFAQQAERDARIEAAAARVAAAQESIRANAERRALAVGAAKQAITAAEQDERDANAAAAEQIQAAVRQLRADALPVTTIAALVQLPATRVRQLIKQNHGTGGGQAAAPAGPAVAGPPAPGGPG